MSLTVIRVASCERGDRRTCASRASIVHDVSFLLWELARHGVVDRDSGAVVHERDVVFHRWDGKRIIEKTGTIVLRIEIQLPYCRVW